VGDAFFAEVVLTGAHRASALAVAHGGADIAAIDAVAWALFGEIEPAARARLAVLGWTEEMPALPFIIGVTHAARAPAIFRALAGAARPGNATGLPVGVLPAADSDYDPIRAVAARVGGLKLAPAAMPLGGR
jgi:ABC-type phosphate/phosphonate transport system substrate-binding protein